MIVSNPLSRRGAFVVLEGLDRSGKTTLAHMLVEQLQQLQIPAKFMRFPGKTNVNMMLYFLN